MSLKFLLAIWLLAASLSAQPVGAQCNAEDSFQSSEERAFCLPKTVRADLGIRESRALAFGITEEQISLTFGPLLCGFALALCSIYFEQRNRAHRQID